jgi:transposase InsO family protein
LEDRSRSPKGIPNKTDEAIERWVVKERQLHGTWGGKKIQTKLKTKYGIETPPCIRTVDAILKRHDMVKTRRRRPGVYKVDRTDLTEPKRPHEVMTVDFKGWFLTGDGEKFEPLTVTDLFSHFLLRANAIPQSTTKWTKKCFSDLFRLEGVPEIIRVDNGAPFASVGPGGLSKLSVWWISLGIEVQFTRPGCPQDNGSHERMHKTMKAECCKPSSINRRAQQLRMNRWRHEFNHERPHESLGQKVPAEVGHWGQPTHCIIFRVRNSKISHYLIQCTG